MDKTIRVMGTLRKNQNKMLEIKQHYNRKGKWGNIGLRVHSVMQVE